MTWSRCRFEMFVPSRRNYLGKIRRTSLKLCFWISTPAKWLRHSNRPIPPFRSHRVYLRSKNWNIFELAETIRFGLHPFIQTGFVPRSLILGFLWTQEPSPRSSRCAFAILEILTIIRKLAALDANSGFGYTESLNSSG